MSPGAPGQQTKCRAAVVTVYQDNIPHKVVSAQAEVISRFLPAGCEFVPCKASNHAVGVDDYFSRGLEHEAYLILDVDCIPLAEWVIPWFLENALAGIVVGPAQRANHLQNDEHIYAGPCALAFSRATYERLDRVSFRATTRGDVGEELTYACEQAGIPVCLLWPTHVTTPKWPLRSGYKFGLGTTFGAAVYHAFEISKRETVPLFVDKCRQILGQSQNLVPGEGRSQRAGWVERSEARHATFHENWYSDDELKLLDEAVRRTAQVSGLIIEIGCWEGRSTAVLANACFPETLIALDTWLGCPTESADHETVRILHERDVYAIFQENIRLLTQGNVEPHRQDSSAFLRASRDPIKFCHIDGPHDYPTVRQTLELLLPRLVPGAILFGHDYATAHTGRDDLHGGVQRAVRELLPQHTSRGNTWLYKH